MNQAGTITLAYTNIQGSIIATGADATTATAAATLATYSESPEFGAPRSPTSNLTLAANSYGWLGEKQRSNNSLAGLILMGVRLYNPATGRFLTTASRWWECKFVWIH